MMVAVEFWEDTADAYVLSSFPIMMQIFSLIIVGESTRSGNLYGSKVALMSEIGRILTH